MPHKNDPMYSSVKEHINICSRAYIELRVSVSVSENKQ